MKYRETELLDRTDVTTTGTKTIPVNVRDPISRIDVNWAYKVTNNMRAQPAADLVKIELTDGSDVLFSMSGLEAQALNIYDRRVETMNSPHFCGGNYHYITASIDFGRWLWDKELAFDPTKFNNPQLKITHDEAAAYADCVDNYLEVFAHCFDEKIISPIGFLMSKLHYAYEPGGDNQYNYIDLPTDFAFRQMLVRGFKSQKDPLDVVDEARLSEENDKRVVFDIELRRYFYRMVGVWKQLKEYWFEYGVGGEADESRDRYFTPTSFMSVLSAHAQRVGSDIHFINAPRGGWMDWRDAAGNMCYGTLSGYLPNHCIQLPFGIQSEMDSWYDAQLKKSIRLRLYSSTEFEDSLVSVILQQLRTY